MSHFLSAAMLGSVWLASGLLVNPMVDGLPPGSFSVGPYLLQQPSFLCFCPGWGSLRGFSGGPMMELGHQVLNGHLVALLPCPDLEEVSSSGEGQGAAWVDGGQNTLETASHAQSSRL